MRAITLLGLTLLCTTAAAAGQAPGESSAPIAHTADGRAAAQPATSAGGAKQPAQAEGKEGAAKPAEQGERAKEAKRAKRRKERKRKRGKRKRRSRDQSGVGLHAGASAGVMHGRGVRRFTAGLTRAELELEPRQTWNTVQLRVPFALHHEQLIGVSLRESGAEGGLQIRWRPTRKLRPHLELGMTGTWRPDWPDLYQPQPDGSLAPTSRHSHYERRAGGGVAAIPFRHHHARIKYKYTLTVYAQDPNFEPIEGPTHLVPGDHEEHRVDLGWRYLASTWKAGMSVELSTRQYFFDFARDAGTGRTHAAAGGPPPNPLYRTLGAEPELSAKLDLLPSVALKPSYGVEVKVDTYEGYYSFVEHQPSIGLELMPSQRVTLQWDYGARWRRYGRGSYAPGPSHPALVYGSRRSDRREFAKLGARVQLASSWFATFDARALVRRTNFPRYQPGVFPAGRAYDIDWNYENYQAMLGIEFR